METSRKSQLLVWDVKDVTKGKRKLLGIICPHCGERALVSKRWRLMQPAEDALLLSHSKGDFTGRVFKTRPCTYCFKASWLPGEEHDVKRVTRRVHTISGRRWKFSWWRERSGRLNWWIQIGNRSRFWRYPS